MRVALLLWTVLTIGCGEGDTRERGVTCSTNYECTTGGARGECQSTGFCAYSDETCADGFRYSPGATGLSSQCVGGPICGSADGAACCAADTCGANLVCGSAGTCQCGGAGEPCCDGADCDGTATCVAGTCTSAWTALAVARNTICGARNTGDVVCWGTARMTYGRGRPAQAIPTIDTITPVVIANATNVVEMQGGAAHFCARTTGNTLWCWGQNAHGQLGNGTEISTISAVQVTGLTNVTAFSVGRQHTCAAGTVAGATGLYCWGHNGRGLHSDPDTTTRVSRIGNNSLVDVSVPTSVDMSLMADAGQTVRDVVAAGYHSCAVMSDNRVWCWGSDDNGTLGTNGGGDTMVPALVDLSQISLGSATIDAIESAKDYSNSNPTCILLSDGNVYCWGNLNAGAGDGTAGSRPRPTTAVTVTSLNGATFEALSPLASGMCALDSTQKVWCWGDGKVGQLGNEGISDVDEYAPVQVVGIPATVMSLASAHRNGCVLDATGRAWCWGSDRRGQLTRTLPISEDAAMITTAIEVLP